MTTTINSQPADWPPEVWAKWHTFAEHADPKLTDDPVRGANYFTPRPYVDEYNTGSRDEGFVYWTAGRHVYIVTVSRALHVVRADGSGQLPAVDPWLARDRKGAPSPTDQ